MKDPFSRRDFLRGTATFGVANLALWAGGCESCVQQIKNRPTRRNISNLAANDPIITTYQQAVTAMKNLPSRDPRNWERQADIHFNSCKHCNWLWLPWHRTYLLYLERICRKLTGDDKFALPYWNWVTHPAIPDAFWGQGNPLFDPNRVATQGEPAESWYIGASVIQNILNEPNFDLFASSKPQSGQDLHFSLNPTTGMLEGTPHNNIHNFVGGDMAQFHSPHDPIFYTHHNMLDCLWTHWNINLNHPNTNDPDWTNFSITDFVDEDGNPVTVSVATTVLFPIFSYQFEPCSLTAGQVGAKLQGKQLEQFLRTGAPSKLEFVKRFELKQLVKAAVDKPAIDAVEVQPEAFRSALEADTRTRVVLSIAEVEVPVQRDFFVRVFLNKPDASATTPIDDPHYAGSFGFFFDEAALKGAEGQTGMVERPKTGFLVDVRPTLTRLNQGGAISSSGKVEVSFVPVPYGHREAFGHLTLGRIELGIARF